MMNQEKIDTKKISLFGMLKNKAEIKTDILEPIEEKWNVEQSLNLSCLDLPRLYTV